MLDAQTDAASLRPVLNSIAGLGASRLKARCAQGEYNLSRAAVCAECGAWFGKLDPVDFHTPCPYCRGAGCAACAHTGFTPQAAAVAWQGLRFTEFLALPVDQAALLFAKSAALPGSAARLKDEINRRLQQRTNV